jgi:hypothetical protein
MQVLQAGDRSLIFLELDADLIARVAEQSGFSCEIDNGARALVADLTAEDREAPLLLFDAADPSNLGWFSRCQFYVDGNSGAILQTPFVLANVMDGNGRPSPRAVRLQVIKELPSGFKLPGRQQVSEQLVYSALAGVLGALTQTGMAICGGSVVKPLTGRSEEQPVRR